MVWMAETRAQAAHAFDDWIEILRRAFEVHLDPRFATKALAQPSFHAHFLIGQRCGCRGRRPLREAAASLGLDASLAERRAPDRADRQGALDNVNLFASGASVSRTRFRHPRLFVVHARQGSDSIWLFDWLCASSCRARAGPRDSSTNPQRVRRRSRLHPPAATLAAAGLNGRR